MTDEKTKDQPGETPKWLGRLGAGLGVVVILVTALFWLFSLNATANYARDQADAHEKTLQQKADKDEVRDGFKELNRKLDQINEFLLRKKR